MSSSNPRNFRTNPNTSRWKPSTTLLDVSRILSPCRYSVSHHKILSANKYISLYSSGLLIPDPFIFICWIDSAARSKWTHATRKGLSKSAKKSMLFCSLAATLHECHASHPYITLFHLFDGLSREATDITSSTLALWIFDFKTDSLNSKNEPTATPDATNHEPRHPSVNTVFNTPMFRLVH